MSMTIEEFTAAALEEPGSFATSCEWAFTTHGRFLTVTRDSDVLGQSNWEVIKADMFERFPDDCEIMPCSHWAVGWTEELFVRVRDDSGEFTEAWQAYFEWYEHLADYPVADEEDLSEREHADALDTLVKCYDVPEDKADAVLHRLWDEHEATRSEEFRDEIVYEAMRHVGIAHDDIPSWMHPEPGDGDSEAPRGYLEGASHINMTTLGPRGEVVSEKIVDANICPHLIFLADHYNDDGPCKCYDESAVEMMTLGYRWKDGLWR